MRIAWAVVLVVGVLVIFASLIPSGASLPLLVALAITVHALGGTGLVR